MTKLRKNATRLKDELRERGFERAGRAHAVLRRSGVAEKHRTCVLKSPHSSRVEVRNEWWAPKWAVDFAYFWQVPAKVRVRVIEQAANDPIVRSLLEADPVEYSRVLMNLITTTTKGENNNGN